MPFVGGYVSSLEGIETIVPFFFASLNFLGLENSHRRLGKNIQTVDLDTPWKFNSQFTPDPKRKVIIFKPSIFQGPMLNFGGVMSVTVLGLPGFPYRLPRSVWRASFYRWES